MYWMESSGSGELVNSSTPDGRLGSNNSSPSKPSFCGGPGARRNRATSTIPRTTTTPTNFRCTALSSGFSGTRMPRLIPSASSFALFLDNVSVIGLHTVDLQFGQSWILGPCMPSNGTRPLNLDDVPRGVHICVELIFTMGAVSLRSSFPTHTTCAPRTLVRTQRSCHLAS